MAITFGTGASNRLQRQLNQTSLALSKTQERLSSGLRINHASDDAAGLSVSTSLNLSSRVFTQGIRNINDGISALSIAQGSLSELVGVTTRIQELAEQAANGSIGLNQRRSSQRESDQLVSEFNRLVATTNFNNQFLVDGSVTNLRIQGGFGSNGGLNLTLTQQLSRNVGTGTFSTNSVTTGSADSIIVDINGDGKNDIVTSSGTNIAVQLGNGDGTFQTALTTAAGGTPGSITSGDFNGDGKLDLAFTRNGVTTIGVILGNGDGTFQGSTNYSLGARGGVKITTGDFNGDGIADIGVATHDTGVGITSGVNILTGIGNGSFNASVISNSAATNASSFILAFDYNGDGKDDILTNDQDSFNFVTYGSGTGSYSTSTLSPSTFFGGPLISGDFNRDGIKDLSDGTSVFLNQGNGNYTKLSTGFSLGGLGTNLAIGDFNGDGYLDIVSTDSVNATTIFGKGDGTFGTGGTTATNRFSSAVGDLNGDGVDDLLLTNSTSAGLYSNTTRTSGIQYFNLTSQSGARSTLSALAAILGRVDSELGTIGAHQSRLQSALNSLQGQNAGYIEASSRIVDADIANEAANSIRLRISQQTAASLAAQANREPEIALSLIRGVQ